MKVVLYEEIRSHEKRVSLHRFLGNASFKPQQEAPLVCVCFRGIVFHCDSRYCYTRVGKEVPLIIMDSDLSDESLSDGEYIVESLLDVKLVQGQEDIKDPNNLTFQYLVKWKDFGDEDNTWEPIENLTGSLDLVHQFKTRKEQLIRKHIAQSGISTGIRRPGPASKSPPVEPPDLSSSSSSEDDEPPAKDLKMKVKVPAVKRKAPSSSDDDQRKKIKDEGTLKPKDGPNLAVKKRFILQSSSSSEDEKEGETASMEPKKQQEKEAKTLKVEPFLLLQELETRRKQMQSNKQSEKPITAEKMPEKQASIDEEIKKIKPGPRSRTEIVSPTKKTEVSDLVLEVMNCIERAHSKDTEDTQDTVTSFSSIPEEPLKTKVDSETTVKKQKAFSKIDIETELETASMPFKGSKVSSNKRKAAATTSSSQICIQSSSSDSEEEETVSKKDNEHSEKMQSKPKEDILKMKDGSKEVKEDKSKVKTGDVSAKEDKNHDHNTNTNKKEDKKQEDQSHTNNAVSPESPNVNPFENPFDFGAEPEEILKINVVHGRIIFLVKFKGYSRNQSDIVTLTQIRYKYPEIVIAFFEKRLKLVDLDLKTGKAFIRDRNPLLEQPLPGNKDNSDQVALQLEKETNDIKASSEGSSTSTRNASDNRGCKKTIAVKKVDPLGLDSSDED